MNNSSLNTALFLYLASKVPSFPSLDVILSCTEEVTFFIGVLQLVLQALHHISLTVLHRLGGRLSLFDLFLGLYLGMIGTQVEILDLVHGRE